MKTIISLIALIIGLPAFADSYTYVFHPKLLPSIPHSHKPRQYAHGSFEFSGEVVRRGFAFPLDLINLDFHYPAPIYYGYSVFDITDDLMFFDVDGNFVDGAFQSTCPWSTYGNVAYFTPFGVIQQNPLGGDAIGTWETIYNP